MSQPARQTTWGHSPIRKIVAKIPAEGHQGNRGAGIIVGLNTTGRNTQATAVAMNQTAVRKHTMHTQHEL